MADESTDNQEGQEGQGGQEAQQGGNLLDGQDAGWFFAEGLAGEGDRPEWFKADKYKTVAEQAKAYAEAERRLGGFTGAPEQYEVNLPEGVEGEFDMDHPVLQRFMETAKEANMSQATFEQLLGTFVEYEASAAGVDMETQKKALGPRADQRLADVRDFLSRNLEENQFAALKGSLVTAEAVEAVESLIALSKAKAPPVEDPTDSGMQSQLQELLSAKDGNGRRLIDTDMNKRREYRELLRKIHGDRPYQEVVGPT